MAILIDDFVRFSMTLFGPGHASSSSASKPFIDKIERETIFRRSLL
jgi:hypothetical protein